jgi:type III secretion protein J
VPAVRRTRAASPPRSRLPRPLLTAASLLALCCGLGCDAELYHDLPERRANEAVLALREAGVHADKRAEPRAAASRAPSFALVVARADEPRALRLLAARGLPRTVSAAPAAGNKLFGLPGDGRSEAAAQLQAALADTLESLPAVQEARVHLALPEPEPLHPLGQLRPTASVLLRLRAPLPLPTAEVALLVARAVPGLDAADVAVISTPPADAAPAALVEAPAALPPAWALPLLLGLCVVLLAACAALLLALRDRSLALARATASAKAQPLPEPEPSPAPKPGLGAAPGRRAFS